jgi:membrane associated rhomboid family serine protease
VIPIGDTIPALRPPLAVWLLILANVVVFLVELAMPPPVREQFFYLFGVVPARFTHPDWAVWLGFPAGNYWPFVTSLFIHGSWLHIISNMLSLWIFGDNVEDRMGSVRFVVFYLLCGVIGGVTHWFVYPDSAIPALGASGAIAGVLGAYLFLFPRSRVIVFFPVLFIPVFFALPAVVFIAFWAFSQLFSGTLSLVQPDDAGGIGWWAHVGGFVAGVVLHNLFVRRGERPPSRDEYGAEVAWVQPGRLR